MQHGRQAEDNQIPVTAEVARLKRPSTDPSGERARQDTVRGMSLTVGCSPGRFVPLPPS